MHSTLTQNCAKKHKKQRGNIEKPIPIVYGFRVEVRNNFRWNRLIATLLKYIYQL